MSVDFSFFRRHFFSRHYWLVMMVVVIGTSACSKQASNTTTPTVALSNEVNVVFENFETGAKSDYTTATANLNSGSWLFTDALLGNANSDVKNGQQAARLINNGSIAMTTDFTKGISKVYINYADQGSGTASTWALWYSKDGGASYQQAGSPLTATSTLSTATFTLNQPGNIRLAIRKTGGSNLLNIDDVEIVANGYNYARNTSGNPIKFLFDASKGETAGNADWVIDQDAFPQQLPTPLQNTITAATTEDYWTGGISAWGIALAKAGHSVQTLPSGAAITFGNNSNALDLSGFDVLVVYEPNIQFTPDEQSAIVRFVQNGGGLMMVANHANSDRNSDGMDSKAIWNDLMQNNPVQKNPFGFSIDERNIIQRSFNVQQNKTSTAILQGSAGNVTTLEFNNGNTLTLQPNTNATVQGLFWTPGAAQSTTNAMAACSFFGAGRVFVLVDSSPWDDGTGLPGNNLFDGWIEFSHAPLALNASYWLAKLQ